MGMVQQRPPRLPTTRLPVTPPALPIAKSQELDRHLVAAIAQFGEKPMPEIGGKSLATDVRVGLAGMKKQIEALRLDAAAAITELGAEITNGQEGVKRIRQ